VEHLASQAESEIIRLVESRDAYMIAPDRLDQNYLDEDLVRGILLLHRVDFLSPVADKHFPPSQSPGSKLAVGFPCRSRPRDSGGDGCQSNSLPTLHRGYRY